ncbi:MAG: class I SAM-dependent methyltransferase [Candidatus Paceibacterota bacterium]
MDWLIFLFSAFFLLMAIPLLFMGAPFLPSFRKKEDIDFKAIFNLLRENGVKKIIDLGSGDGRIVLAFAEAGFESYGVELNPLLVWWSRKKIKKFRMENKAKIKWGNFWKTDLKDFDAVFIFQFKTANKLLSEKFKKELKENSLIISVGFSLSDFKFIKKISSFFIYKK